MQESPAQTLKIAPESLEVANKWLLIQDSGEVARELGLPITDIQSILDKKEVRAYINHVFFEVGYNNRSQMRHAMDTLIKRKFKDLEEADTGSGKDIADLLQLSHKMTMDHLDKEIQLKKLEESIAIKNQTNIQINEAGMNNYSNLLEKLLEAGNK